MRVLSFFVTILLFLNFVSGSLKSTDSNENELESSVISSLPGELIIHIGQYLLGKDFQNFALTNSSIRATVINYENFFMPKEEQKVIEKIQSTHILAIDILASKWGRESKKRVFTELKNISEKFSNYVISLGCFELTSKEMINEVDIYIKCQRIKAFLGSVDAKDDLIIVKDSIMCNMISRVNEEELG